MESIGHRQTSSNISARGHCGLNIFADSERGASISYKWSFITRWLNHTVWKLLIIEVLAVISLLRRKSDGFRGRRTLDVIFIIRIPKRHFLVSRRVVWAINHQYWFRRSTCGRAQEKNREGKWWLRKCVKKGQKCYISRMCRTVPRLPIVTKMCT